MTRANAAWAERDRAAVRVMESARDRAAEYVVESAPSGDQAARDRPGSHEARRGVRFGFGLGTRPGRPVYQPSSGDRGVLP